MAEYLCRDVAPFFLMTPFAVFFLRQFFLGISRAPDVFTDHLNKYPQFAESEVIEPLSTRGVEMDQYLPGAGRAVEVPGRQAVRLSEGLGHGRVDRNQDMLDKAGISERQPGTPTTAARSSGSWPG